jgi:SagB-type dehydrogenase family enzyme
MTAHKSDYANIITLPEPNCDGEISIENAILNRRSIRDYLNEPLILTDVSQLLWAAQGITESGGYRAAPSGGALYPLEVYLVAGNVMNLLKGIYRYRPLGHEMIKVADGDMRNELASAALEQGCIRRGAVSIVVSAVYERMTRKYGQRGLQYVHMEVGHAAQNIYLQAISLNLGTVVVGAFYDDEVKTVLKMPEEEHPLCIMPVGRIKKLDRN